MPWSHEEKCISRHFFYNNNLWSLDQLAGGFGMTSKSNIRKVRASIEIHLFTLIKERTRV